MNISEIKNEEYPKIAPIKEVMNVKIPNIMEGIPNRNGFIWCLAGSGGSGKSSLLLNFFRTSKLYRRKFDNIYLFTPMASFLSVANHPFKEHDKIYYELTYDSLNNVYKELLDKKESREKDEEMEYSLVIIDDFASSLKTKEIERMLNKMLIKTRHLGCAFIFTLQSYFYFPKILRKQLTNITIFKSKNYEEYATLAKELMNLNKEDALKLYDYIFLEPYAHLDIDCVDNVYYKNFNQLTFEKTT